MPGRGPRAGCPAPTLLRQGLLDPYRVGAGLVPALVLLQENYGTYHQPIKPAYQQGA
jgi:hypothetical protein